MGSFKQVLTIFALKISFHGRLYFGFGSTSSKLHSITV